MTLVNRSARLAGRGATLAATLLVLLIAPPTGAGSESAQAAPAATTTVYDWGWENPLPQGNNLNGVSCPAATLCKAVGDSGTIVSWDGTSWSADSSGTTSILYGVSCPAATLCKAVGVGGTILGLVVQTLTDVEAGFALDLFQTGCLDGVAITQTNSNHPNATASQQTGKYWTITPSPAGCTSGYSAFLTLPTTFTPDANSRVCRYTGSGTTWDCAQNGFTASSVNRWNVTQLSDWAASTSPPTAVRLAALTARARPGGVAVRWQTASELELVGFDLYRQQGGKLVKLNRALIPSVFGGATKGHAYSFLDRSARRGVTSAYRLQAVSLGGTRAWLGTAVARRSPDAPSSASLPNPRRAGGSRRRRGATTGPGRAGGRVPPRRPPGQLRSPRARAPSAPDRPRPASARP